MKPQSQALLIKAARAVRAAGKLLEEGDLDFSAGRAYYAMFYAASAALYEKDKSFSKHSGVHAAFGELFAKSGALDPKFHRYLLDAFAKRLDADYGFEITLGHQEVEVLIAQAGEFVAAIRSHVAGG